jgi:sodium-dependent phosphate cotransporter
MVMGANVGTTITNTLVSLGHARHRDEFRRAFAAATVHDFFNVLSIIVFLPLELAFGLLERWSLWLMNAFSGDASLSMSGLNFLKPLTKPVIDGVKGLLMPLGDSVGGVMLILIGIALIFFSITYLGKLLRRALVGRAKAILHAALGRGPVSGIASGTAVTVLVQSSSTTTSLVVPLAGSGLFTVRDIYPFTLGANIGTCITALLAATAVTGENAAFAAQIALIHLLYNCLGVLVVYGIPFLREIPPRCSEWLANLAAVRRPLAIAYVAAVFFLIPGLLVGLTAKGEEETPVAPKTSDAGEVVKPLKPQPTS